MKPDLVTQYGVSSIGVFGSVTREDFTENSDIDILVDFSRPIGIEFVDLAELLEKKLERKVDLVSLDAVKPRLFNYIKDDLIYV